MEQLASIHVNAFYNLPPGALDALMQGTTQALIVQERYAQVAVCGFMVLSSFGVNNLIPFCRRNSSSSLTTLPTLLPLLLQSSRLSPIATVGI